MRFKCVSQNCGRIIEVDPGQPAPKFCTSCGSNLAQEGASELNLKQTAETVGESGTAVFRRLTEITAKTVEQTTTSTQRPKSINTGILSRLPVTGPPAAEPEDIPLFRVVAAPPGLLHDGEIPARQEDGPAPAADEAQDAQSEAGLSGSVEEAEVALEEESDDLFENLAEPATEEEETSPDDWTGAAADAGAGQAVQIDASDDQFFAMLGAQLPENIAKAGASISVPSSPEPRAEATPSSPEVDYGKEQGAVDDEDDIPGDEYLDEPSAEAADADSEAAAESEHGSDSELMRMLQDDAQENPERTSEPSSVSVRTDDNEFANAAGLLGTLEPGATVAGEDFLHALLESLRYVLRGSGAHLLIFSAVLWMVTFTVVMKVGPYAAAPLMLAQLILVACTGLTSILLGSKGLKAALLWPAGEGWGVLLKCLLRFVPIDLSLACLALVSGFIAKGYVLLVPILMVTSSMIICLDSKWNNIFSPKRHLRLLTANPLVMLKMLALGCVLGMLSPVVIGMVISIFTGGAMDFWMLKLAFWFSMSGPIGWMAGTAAGYAIGLLYAAHAGQFDEDAPAKGYENTVAAGMLGICLLLSFVF
ncbi:MAG: hypothetical protein QGG53_32955 [Planctomycetota bacterium]|jgi:hypothetical protein|nr:hypothetical protein [Planctomycetota bacterium]